MMSGLHGAESCSINHGTSFRSMTQASGHGDNAYQVISPQD